MELIAVTNRKLCETNFQEQLKRLAESGVSAIILREKDLTAEAYLHLALQCQQALAGYAVPLMINQQIEIALQLQIMQLQLSFPQFAERHQSLKAFARVLVSVHNVEEAQRAAQWGAHGLIAGHIFETDCKKNIAPRGLTFLQQICNAVHVPVYAIGGINGQTYPLVQQSQAAGVCVMSHAMKKEKFFWQIG